MQKRRFGRTGLQVPALTFGGGWVGGLLIRGTQEVRDGVLNKALAAGIDWVDRLHLRQRRVRDGDRAMAAHGAERQAPCTICLR